MKKILTAISVVFLSACIIGCTPSEVKEAQDAIDAIGEVTLDSQDAITEANAKYDALDEDFKEQVENRQVLEDANKRIAGILRSEIEIQIGKADDLGFDYFARYYDMSEVEAAKAAAQNILSSSNESEYASTYYALKNANRAFAAYIDEERANSYSTPTNNGDYPFAIDTKEFPQSGGMLPVVKQNSNYPFQVNLAAPRTTDELPGIGYCMADNKGGGYSYDYEIIEIETKEINVKDANGDVKRAFVNSKLNLTDLIGESDDAEVLIRENSYLLKTASGELNLVIPDLEGGDFYIPYRA